jgi:hypothetical protein
MLLVGGREAAEYRDSRKSQVDQDFVWRDYGVLNHLMSILSHAMDVGALTPFLWGFERETDGELISTGLRGRDRI